MDKQEKTTPQNKSGESSFGDIVIINHNDKKKQVKALP